MKKTIGTLILVSVSLVATSAWAADPDIDLPYVADGSWYIEARGGGAVAKNHGFDSTSPGTGQYKPDTGYSFSIDIGKYITDNWRAEIGYYRNTGADGNAVLDSGGAPIPHSGSVDTNSFMANLLYAFDMGSDLKPYAGGGLGFTYVKFNSLGATTGGTFTVTGSDTVFTAALHAGLDYKVMDRVTLTSRYSLAWIDGGSYGTTIAGMNVTTTSETESVFGFGVRLDLN